ncbi:MAG: hypothetical protein Alis3KO_05640 [Aliiglaciecola sp.]
MTKQFLLLAFITLALSACGGGGEQTPEAPQSSGSAQTTPTDTPPNVVMATTSLELRASEQLTIDVTATDDNGISMVVWELLSGNMTLSQTNDSSATLLAGNVTTNETAQVQVTVTDTANQSVSETVSITLLPIEQVSWSTLEWETHSIDVGYTNVLPYVGVTASGEGVAIFAARDRDAITRFKVGTFIDEDVSNFTEVREYVVDGTDDQPYFTQTNQPFFTLADSGEAVFVWMRSDELYGIARDMQGRWSDVTHLTGAFDFDIVQLHKIVILQGSVSFVAEYDQDARIQGEPAYGLVKLSFDLALQPVQSQPQVIVEEALESVVDIFATDEGGVLYAAKALEEPQPYIVKSLVNGTKTTYSLPEGHIPRVFINDDYLLTANGQAGTDELMSIVKREGERYVEVGKAGRFALLSQVTTNGHQVAVYAFEKGYRGIFDDKTFWLFDLDGGQTITDTVVGLNGTYDNTRLVMNDRGETVIVSDGGVAGEVLYQSYSASGEVLGSGRIANVNNSSLFGSLVALDVSRTPDGILVTAIGTEEAFVATAKP